MERKPNRLCMQQQQSWLKNSESNSMTIHPDFLCRLSKNTLGSYIKKAVDDVNYHSYKAADLTQRPTDKGFTTDKNYTRSKHHEDKANQRQRGIEKAVDKLTKS